MAPVFFLAACDRSPSLTEIPYVPHPDGAQVVSVCYDGDHRREEIEAVAREGCTRPDARVVPWKADTVFNECPIMKKRRISFVCVPPAGAQPPR